MLWRNSKLTVQLINGVAAYLAHIARCGLPPPQVQHRDAIMARIIELIGGGYGVATIGSVLRPPPGAYEAVLASLTSEEYKVVVTIMEEFADFVGERNIPFIKAAHARKRYVGYGGGDIRVQRGKILHILRMKEREIRRGLVGVLRARHADLVEMERLVGLLWDKR